MKGIPPPVTDFCLARGYGKIRKATPLGGGSPENGVNNAARLDTDNGPLFLKVNAKAPPDMFEREAEGLTALATAIATMNRRTGWRGPALGVPRALLAGPGYILQEFLESGPKHDRYWEVLGMQLALMHQTTSDRFGFVNDNYIGRTPQINTWEANGYRFFADQRLLYQADLARRNKKLDAATYDSLLDLFAKLASLIPPQSACLIHGDLWSGNLHTGPDGEPVLIDPAAHYGWAEADLAMLTLFGSPPDSFFHAYDSVSPLQPGYRERFDLYNLYHLLNHLNLFGENYASSVRTIVERFI